MYILELLDRHFRNAPFVPPCQTLVHATRRGFVERMRHPFTSLCQARAVLASLDPMPAGTSAPKVNSSRNHGRVSCPRRTHPRTLPHVSSASLLPQLHPVTQGRCESQSRPRPTQSPRDAPVPFLPTSLPLSSNNINDRRSLWTAQHRFQGH